MESYVGQTFLYPHNGAWQRIVIESVDEEENYEACSCCRPTVRETFIGLFEGTQTVLCGYCEYLEPAP